MLTWDKQDKGWYTSEIGDVSEEAPGKWFFWPKTLGTPKRLGPWKTLRAAQQGSAAMETASATRS